MRCSRCDADLAGKAVAGLCPVCLLDSALTDDIASGDGAFRYDLVEEIARGGMGVVYRATQHGSQRQVAVKMILDDQTSAAGMLERFRAEAEAIASLEHPNILPVYEAGEYEGRPFYSMKLANGGSLRESIAGYQKQPRKAAALIARVARAVHHAHERGILHRDLKPGNILLDGAAQTPYVSDFGLAKWIGRQNRLTIATSALGTPHYIAPEQAAGASEKLTPAADVYSLGAMLYELLSGRPPFEGDTALETLRLAAQQAPAPPRKVDPTVPLDLELICLKCLAKEPAARYASAEALADDLDRWLDGRAILVRRTSPIEHAWHWTKRNRSVAALSAALLVALATALALFAYREVNPDRPAVKDLPPKSVAVLPFENLTPTADNAYFAQGIQDEILSRLAKVAELKVISRASTERFTSSARNLPEIAQQLGVANLLQGNVRTAGDAIRVHVQLINASTKEHLWSETYDRKLKDLFAVETEIAKAVADKLQARLTGSETRAIAARPTENAAAYELYLKGRFFWNKRTAADLKKAIDYFDQAIALDPKFALAHAALAETYVLAPFYGAGTAEESCPKVKAAAHKALAIDANLAQAHVALGEAARICDLDLEGAATAFRRGLELDPNYANGHHWYGFGVLVALGRFDEAISEMKRALELDPLSLIINADFAATLMFARRYDDSIEQYRRTIEMDPNFQYARWGYGVVLELKGECAAAFREFEAARRLNGDPWVRALQAHAHSSCGDKVTARRLVDELNEVAKSRPVSNAAQTVAHLALGDKDAAIRSLETGYQQRGGSDLQYVTVDPYFDVLRGDPRFDALVAKLVPAARTAATATAANSIAVLPFQSIGDETANAYFATGIQDELLVRLSKIADLKVISRTSTEKYKSAPANLPEVAEQLGVTHVLEGSVQKTGDRARITVQLINAKSDAHLWAETYDRKLSDIFEVQTDVAQRIAGSLEAKLSGRERQEIARVPTTNTEAYDAYLRGLSFDAAQTMAEFDRAIQLHRRAVELDPNFAIAWAKLAEKESEKYAGYVHSPEQLAHARLAAETALRLQPDLAEAQQAAGLFHYYCLQDFDRALAELNKARERAPNNAGVLVSIAVVNRRQGKLEESIERLREAANLDPRNVGIWQNLGRSYRGARRFADAHATLDRGLTVAPRDLVTTMHKAEVYVAEGNLEAAERLTSTVDLHPLDDPYGRSVSALTFRRQYDRAIAVISADLKRKEGSPPLAALGRALIAQLEYAKRSPGAESLLKASERELLALAEQGSASFRIRQVLIELEAALGQRDQVERQAEALLRHAAKDRWQASLSEEAVARAYAILGDTDRAIAHVEQALAETGYGALTPAYLRFDPVWDRIRNDPRFERLTSDPAALSRSIGDTPAKSIAVLPFTDLSEKKDQEYFCDGVSEEVLGALAKIDGLQVAARTSSFSFKGKSADIKQIASVLGVQNVLEGSVRREGNRVRVAAQLINAQSGFHIWSQTFDRELQSIFAVQDEMARAIADALKVRLAGPAPKRRAPNLEAYDLYLQGMFLSNKSGEKDLRESVKLFERSLEKDPNSAAAWTGLARAWFWLTDGYVKPLEGYPKVKAAALRAVELDDRNGEAHALVADCARVLERDVVGAERRLLHAIEVDPNAAYPYLSLALTQGVLGKRESALQYLEKALKADPLSPPISNLAGLLFIGVGDVDRAIETGRRTLQIDPEYIYMFPMLGPAYAAKGMLNEAVALYRKAQEITGMPQAGLAVIYAQTGRRAEALEILKELKRSSERAYFPAEDIAQVYVALGDKDEAFRWLDRAVAEHSGALQAIAIRPTFDALYDDPRFHEILRRLGLDPAVSLAR